MKAVGFTCSLPASDPQSLIDFETPQPAPAGLDLLVEVQAVSVNPVDYRVRRDQGPASFGTRILGYDAAGIVTATGPDCRLFRPGDAVWYAGAVNRQGSNSQFQLVDERVVGRKPASLAWADAAAMPLTLITAWEALHEQLRVRRDGGDAGRRLLLLGGAGGVGSIAMQLAKLAGLTVIATASRPDSIAQCRHFGADLVLDHTGDLKAQLAAAGHTSVDLVFSCAEPDAYLRVATELLAPFGSFCTILAPRAPVDLGLLRQKSLRYSHEYMFTRPVYQPPDMIEQHRLLGAAAMLFDAGRLRSTRSATLGPINAANLRQAHAQLETTHTLGKLVLQGWD
jgi:zinc-binding alcohol dehydrogenase family protein